MEINIFQPYIIALKEWFNNPVTHERLLKEGYTQKHLDEAVGLYEQLATETNEEYLNNRKELFSNDATRERFLESIAKLQHNVIKIGDTSKGVSEDFAMTKKESIAQCKRADEAFTERPDLEKLLADANYSFFPGRTMATAKDLLKLDISSFYTEGMPHLTASNGAIGFSIKEYILDMAKEGETTFTITDMGSGSGATLAGIILGLVEADKNLDKKIKVITNSIEGCYAFYNVLTSEMVPAIKEEAKRLSNIDLEINLHYGDIQKNIFSGKVEGTQIYTANYLFHRLSDASKKYMFERIGKQIGDGNAAFFVADIYRNISEMPNRMYFNLSFNGPLNPGNDLGLMERLFYENRFRKIISDRNMGDFKGLPIEIVNACNLAKQKEQGFLITGYK